MTVTQAVISPVAGVGIYKSPPSKPLCPLPMSHLSGMLPGQFGILCSCCFISTQRCLHFAQSALILWVQTASMFPIALDNRPHRYLNSATWLTKWLAKVNFTHLVPPLPTARPHTGIELLPSSLSAPCQGHGYSIG